MSRAAPPPVALMGHLPDAEAYLQHSAARPMIPADLMNTRRARRLAERVARRTAKKGGKA